MGSYQAGYTGPTMNAISNGRPDWDASTRARFSPETLAGFESFMAQPGSTGNWADFMKADGTTAGAPSGLAALVSPPPAAPSFTPGPPQYALDNADRYSGMIRGGGQPLRQGLDWLMAQERPRMTPAMLDAMRDAGNPLTTAQVQQLADRGDPWAKDVAGQWPMGGGGGLGALMAGGGPGQAGNAPATGGNAGVAGPSGALRGDVFTNGQPGGVGVGMPDTPAGGAPGARPPGSPSALGVGNLPATGRPGVSGGTTPFAGGGPGAAGNDPFATPTGAINVANTVANGVYRPFELPDTQGAMARLRDLQTQAVGGYSDLLSADPYANRQRFQDALYSAGSEPILRDAGDLFRRLNEGTFGRGMGLSSISTDNTGRLARETNDALSRAGRDAYLGAGAESRADQASRLSALGAAFNAGTGGLQGEANVGLTNAGREQSANQFGANMGFQGLENSLNRAQQESQFTRGLDQQKNLAEDAQANALLTTGISGGLSGLAALFGPSLAAGRTGINDYLGRTFGYTPGP